MEAIAQLLGIKFSWEIKGGPQSGFSLQVQDVESTEDRATKIETLIESVENPLYNIVRDIKKKTNLLEADIEDGKLTTDFADPEKTEEPRAKLDRDKFELENDIVTALDLIMERNPDLDEEGAMKIYEDNKKFNAERADEEQRRAVDQAVALSKANPRTVGAPAV